jgi:4,5-DOPA dioxygenase extradiol
MRMPTVFVSHGSPMLAIEDSLARRFLSGLGSRLPQPKAVVVFSAHYDAPQVHVTGAPAPRTIHDFGGFPPELYRLRYAAPGEPALAAEISALLSVAALPSAVEPARGLDHGVWVPLRLMYPDAAIPVLEVSIDSGRRPEHHFALGRALRPLRERGVLLLGSGGATHNLAAYFAGGSRDDTVPPEWVEAFNEWTAGAIAERRFDDLLDYARRAPYAAQNHPTSEHYLPLFCVLGAAYDAEAGERLHASYDRGVLSLDAYGFGMPPGAITQRVSEAQPAVLH